MLIDRFVTGCPAKVLKRVEATLTLCRIAIFLSEALRREWGLTPLEAFTGQRVVLIV